MNESSDLRDARARVTLRDVATAAGVDPSLVSRVVNNDPKAAASVETRQRILQLVEELGYRANVAARGLASSRTRTLGLLLPDLSNPMYESILTGVAKEATIQGYGVIVGTRADDESEESFSRLLQTGPVDGLLVASGLLSDEYLRRITRGGGPVVLVNRRVQGVRSSVTVDDAAGAALAIDHLVGLGHREIAAIFGPDEVDTSLRRRNGYETAMHGAGLESRALRLRSWRMADGYQASLELLRHASRPTAVFASTIAMGIGTLRAARELDLDVPRQLSVVALHDVEIAEYLAPSLTVVRMPTVAMGRKAVKLLVSIIDGGKSANTVVKGPIEVIHRESTAEPPA
jgi:LacI family transcriptional regulator